MNTINSSAGQHADRFAWWARKSDARQAAKIAGDAVSGIARVNVRVEWSREPIEAYVCALRDGGMLTRSAYDSMLTAHNRAKRSATPPVNVVRCVACGGPIWHPGHAYECAECRRNIYPADGLITSGFHWEITSSWLVSVATP